jgi:zinc/manganese transport system substrate-binding protein
MNSRIVIIAITVLFAHTLPWPSYAAKSKILNVIASTETVASLVKEIGGSAIKVDSFSRGTEDPHYIEAKPSFMGKTSLMR